MKYLIFTVLIFLSGSGFADVYQYCQTQIEIVQSLNALSAEELIEKKQEVAKADTIDELSKATGNDYQSMTSMLSEMNLSEEQASIFIMQGMKAFEIKNISLAISIKALPEGPDEQFWNKAFDACVEGNRDQF